MQDRAHEAVRWPEAKESADKGARTSPDYILALSTVVSVS